jgi:hypothetical protein
MIEDCSTKGKRKKEDADEQGQYMKYYKLPESTPPVNIKCGFTFICKSIKFNSYEEYELHFKLNHVNKCDRCKMLLPTAHFLHLHILETHDSLFKVRKETKFECFVEDCQIKFIDDEERKEHLILEHFFQMDYDFDILRKGLPKERKEPSKLREVVKEDIDCLIDSMANVKFVPRSVTLSKKINKYRTS